MRFSSRTTTYSGMLARLALIIFASVLGHHVVMAVHEYDQTHDFSHYGVEVEQCVAHEGHVQSPAQLSTVHVAAETSPAFVIGWSAGRGHPDPMGHDTFMTRAMLQVYLN